ncbi:MAG: carbon-nitrogen hydrolase family protein [Helicobacter sp.]|uniref:carbon-nitrogen hydrolase family protein n=1 Tax=Helicobacter sp. TaxID=218 RepID=UPI0025C2C084|nr:carbon-nitrogen hydrolase family protein [Helicobacter sp.]MCH5313698.1 carbon-nitrogen hydrolase family protein [Helicobacter sp.]
MNIALLQLPSLAPNDARLGKYLQSCKKQKVQIAAFSEYVFQPFYRDIDKDSKAFHSSYAKILKALQKLSLKYKLDLLVPLLVSEDKKLYKSIALIEGEKVRFYHQQRLIAYPHWNEKQFFDNPLPKAPKAPLIFEKEGLKIAVIAGFEIHFDEIWLKLKLAQVDVVFLPCSNAFASKQRWQILCQARAFSNSMAILRINGIQKRFYDDAEWNFYGDSCFINADGQIEDSLEEREGMMIVELQAQHIKDIQEQWGFR